LRAVFINTLLAIVAISPVFCDAVLAGAKKIHWQKRNSFLPPVVPQNIEITHDLIATADRVADHTQRIINLKN
jgi:hypothetical protein